MYLILCFCISHNPFPKSHQFQHLAYNRAKRQACATESDSEKYDINSGQLFCTYARNWMRLCMAVPPVLN